MKKTPLRMCLGCRAMKPKQELFRIVRPPEGEIALDKTGKMNGRGAYICKDTECYKRVVKTKALPRALGAPIPENVWEELNRE